MYESPSGEIVNPTGVPITLIFAFQYVLYDYGLTETNPSYTSENLLVPFKEQGDYLISIHNLKTNEYYKDGEIEITETSGYKYMIKPNSVITMTDDIEMSINYDSFNDTWDTGPFIKKNTDDDNRSNSYACYSLPFIQIIKQ